MAIDSTEHGRTGLPRSYFLAQEVFERETERIFSHHWICLGHLSEFANPPAFRAVQVGSYNVVVVRQSETSVVAFHNVCRHRGARLVTLPQGNCSRGSLTCPYHAWTYNLNGELIAAPNMVDRPEFRRADFSLHPVTASVWNGLVMIRIQNEGATSSGVPKVDSSKAGFASEFDELVQRLANWSAGGWRPARTIHYQVRANWKLLFQNYSECYHCPSVHPALNRLTPYKSAANDLTSGPILGGPMELDQSCQSVSKDGKFVAQPFPDLTELQRRRVYYYTVFPSVFVSAHPDYVMIHVLNRLDRFSTEVTCSFFVSEAAELGDLDLSRAVDLWDEINRQDWQVCELTQLGIESPAFEPGPYSPLESMVAAFDSHYLSVLGDS